MTGEGMNTEREEARGALDVARADHARALLAAQAAPDDPDARRRLQEAVRGGRGAWRAYQQAATAGLAAEIAGIVPGAFRDADGGGE